MIRTVACFATFFALAGSFAACSSGDGDPLGDVDGGTSSRTTSGTSGTSGNDFGGSSSSSGSDDDPVYCEDTLDCPEGQTCEASGANMVCVEGGSSSGGTGADGGSTSSSSGGSSSGNPSGGDTGASCEVDGDCQSGFCVTSKTTGVLYCSKSCTTNDDCPTVLPRCGDEVDANGDPRPTKVCRADI